MKRLAHFLLIFCVAGSFMVIIFSCSSKNPADSNPTECDHIDAEGLLVEASSVLAQQWEGTVTGNIEVLFGDSTDVLTVVFLDADSVRINSALCDEHTLRLQIADTAIATVDSIPGQKWKFIIRGQQIGTTSLVLRIWHVNHTDFTSQQIPVSVTSSTPHSPLGATALAISRNGNMLANWNYHPSGLNQVFGAVVVEQGLTTDIDIQFLDTLKDADSARISVIPADSGYSLAWQLADSTITSVTLVTGERWKLRVNGLTIGKTTISVRLLWNGVQEFSSGAIPIYVRSVIPVGGDSAASCMITKGGVWWTFLRHGEFTDGTADCARTTAVPNQFELQAGVLTDLYSFFLPDAADSCNRVQPAESKPILVFDFADAGIARSLYHPVHWGEYRIFHLKGVAVGNTSVRMHYIKNNAVVFSTPYIPIVVAP